MSRSVYTALVVMVVMVFCTVGSAAAPAAAPAAKSAIEDHWLSVAALAELALCKPEADACKRLKARADAALAARLGCGEFEHMEALTDLLFVSRACGLLGVVAAEENGEKTAKWLLDHRDLLRSFVRALGETAPAEPIAALQELVAADEKAVLDYPNLAVAFAVTKPLPYVIPQPNPADRVTSFKWYANPKSRFRFDMKTLPVEAAMHLAGTRLSLEERRWACDAHFNVDSPAKCFFLLRHNFENGASQKSETIPYTLPNLRRMGGVGTDMAYYAAEVSRAIGIPAAVAVGRQSEQEAWLVYLRGAGKDAAWDNVSGRLKELKGSFGKVADPVSGEMVSEHDLILSACMIALAPQQREETDAAVVLALRVEKLLSATEAVTPAAIESFAGSYNARPESAKAPANTKWLASLSTLDGKVLAKLLNKALQINPGNRAAWLELIHLRKEDILPLAEMGPLMDFLYTRLQPQFPDFCYTVAVRLIMSVKDAAVRQKMFTQALGLYAKRPDLSGRFLIAIGDDFLAQDNKEKAIGFYRDAAFKAIDFSDIVMAAADKYTNVVRDAPRGKEAAIALYQRLLSLARADFSANRQQSAYYLLGMRLAELYDDSNQPLQAKHIRDKINTKH